MDYDHEDFDGPDNDEREDSRDDLFDIRRESLWDREASFGGRYGEEEADECPGPDEGGAESGPPASIEPCCEKHFPTVSAASDTDFGDDDLPF